MLVVGYNYSSYDDMLAAYKHEGEHIAVSPTRYHDGYQVLLKTVVYGDSKLYVDVEGADAVSAETCLSQPSNFFSACPESIRKIRCVSIQRVPRYAPFSNRWSDL